MTPYKMPRISGTTSEQVAGLKSAMMQLITQLNMQDIADKNTVEQQNKEERDHYTKKEVEELLEKERKKYADYPVEIGTSGIWAYRKWKSGFTELRGTLSLTVAAGISSASESVDFPFNLTSVRGWLQSGAYGWNYAKPMYLSTSATKCTVYIYPKDTSTGYTYTVSIYITGQSSQK